jgi:uncharacterized protein (UPF0332 family)
MEGKDFLELAKKLQSFADEASLRTSVSRSYYAIFNHVKDFLNTNGISMPKAAQAHEKAHQYLSNSGIDEALDLADDLDNMRNRRNDADYEMRSPKYAYDKKNCGLISAKAMQFLDNFDKLNRGRLVKGILDYKKRTNN